MTLPCADIAVIGGSGVYDLPELENRQWLRVDSSFGTPSDEFLFGTVHDVRLVFVPRHGRGHVLSPAAINYRANIDALKRVGVQDVISVSAVGSLVDDLPPGMFVLVDQYIDRTVARESSFFGAGCVAHVSMAHPTCRQLSQLLHRAALENSLPCHLGGTYLALEGPQFSSLAESNLYRAWNCHVIGMTNMPEAKLAREAELCYSSICMVTDYDCWHPHHESVTVADVVQVMGENSRNAQRLLLAAIPLISQAPDRASWHGRRALENAIITSKSARDRTMVKRLSAVAGRVLGHHA
jgi:5'-methylthioadenosine phosphorylase